MAESINTLLAKSLKTAKKNSRNNILKTSQLSRADRERLQKAFWLDGIMKGWYMLTTPDGGLGNSTAWYIQFWPFVSYYLSDRFGSAYCLSAESSLDVHVGENTIAPQIIILTENSANQVVDLPHNTSILIYSEKKNFPDKVEVVNEINVMPLPLAICRLSSNYFQQKPLNVEIALKLLGDVSSLSRVLIEHEMVTSAGRVAGALKAIGNDRGAEKIIKDMEGAGFAPRIKQPFEKVEPLLGHISKLKSPHCGRIEAIWKKMRPEIMNLIPDAPPSVLDTKKRLRIIKELYQQDAYHSLSIEGYQVTEELIRKVANGDWDPENVETDKKQRDVLAAKGYHSAFKSVLKSVVDVLKGQDAGAILERDMGTWYRELFSPLVKAGFLKAGELSGYRNSPVYIRGSNHVPPGHHAVTDAMETLFELIKKENDPRVRAILGHFVFVFIHPYQDGNGRIARFLMNLMLVSGGYDWVVVRTNVRTSYMKALESASVKQDIRPFCKVIKKEIDHWKPDRQ